MKTLVREPLTGEPLLCCWDDCGQWGDDRIKIVVTTDKRTGATLTYIFCSRGHEDFWRNSMRDNGNHSPGNRTQFGLIAPS